jgi:hypothetical protein
MNKIDTSEIFTLYPHIGFKIKTLWGTKECRALLMSLLNDSREGKRAGFPISVGQTIISLINAHDSQFPRFDDTGEFIVPFTSVRSRPQPIQKNHDWGIIGTAAKFIAFVVIASIFYKIFFYKILKYK